MQPALTLDALTPEAFEHLVNDLAIRVLGSGHTTFGPGSDGGRDGYYQGEAPYPSSSERWRGRWYIQAKYHAPHLSADAQTWLRNQIQAELDAFASPSSKRIWPDIWIVASNVNPSPTPETGTFDRALKMVRDHRPELADRFHLWGGDKILSLLRQHPDVAECYGHFLTPGDVLAQLAARLRVADPTRAILEYLIETRLEDDKYTKLDQAGSSADHRPGIHELFVDLPFRCPTHGVEGEVASALFRAAERPQRLSPPHRGEPQANWAHWGSHPGRASVWFIKAGPGRGKSTVGQYFCQIQRAALLLARDPGLVHPDRHALALDIERCARSQRLLPKRPRIPIYLELKDYAQWLSERPKGAPRLLLAYLARRIGAGCGRHIHAEQLEAALLERRWFVVFDGLDEVPGELKDSVAREVCGFIRSHVPRLDLFVLCTSRPQGYAGQFNTLSGMASIELSPLDASRALQCAGRLLALDRSEEEANKAKARLANALASPAVCELMTTPLQAHIMAVIVRNGQRPPERKWQLYHHFYEVIRQRETNRELPDAALSKLLREDPELIKAVHDTVGFMLHAKAERAAGAEASLSKEEFREIVTHVVQRAKSDKVAELVQTVVTAVTERLVLITTPDDGARVRYDIRQLQEFFAAEFVYEDVEVAEFERRLLCLASDSHWREVMHFVLSAVIEKRRRTEVIYAADVLRRIDDDFGPPETRELRRRLAPGALLLIALLADGVLEPHRELREKFAVSLQGAASLRTSRLAYLLERCAPETTRWLLRTLIDRMATHAPHASLGAATLAWHFLTDDDPMLPRYLEELESKPPRYRASVLDDAEHCEPGWQENVGLRALLDDRMISTLSPQQITTSSANLCRDPGIAQLHQVSYLRSILDEELHLKEFGGWIVTWSSVTRLVEPNLSSLACSLGQPRSGGLEITRRALRAACSHSRADVIDWLELTLAYPGSSCWTPAGLSPHLPSNPDAELLRRLRELDDDDFSSEFSRMTRRIASVELKHPDQANVDVDWTALLEYSADAFLCAWHTFLQRDTRQLLQGTEPLLRRALQKHPPYAYRIQPRFWGHLFTEGEHPWPTFIERYVRPSGKSRSSFAEWRPLALRLPNEQLLLPAVLAELHELFSLDGRHLGDLPSRRRKLSLKRCHTLVPGFLPNLSELVQISRDGVTQAVREAAVVLLLLHPEGSVALAHPALDHLLETAVAVSDEFVSAACAAIELLGVKGDGPARAFISRILEADRNLTLPAASETLLARWRERSTAPLSRDCGPRSWLGLSQ